MDPTLAQRLDRYDIWFDHADAHIDAWFDAASRADPNDPDAILDHKALGSVVTTMRRVIEGRRALHDWIRNEQQIAHSQDQILDDARLLQLLEDCACGDEDSVDEEPLPD